MDRLVKKCVISSGLLHGTLLLVLLVGPAFLGSSPKVDPGPVLTFIPVQTIDQNLSGGGNPNVPLTLPAPAPPTPKPPVVEPPLQPKPEPKPEPMPKPDPEPVKTSKPEPAKADPDPLEVKKKPHKVDVSLKKVSRTDPKTTKTSEAADAEARAIAKAEGKKRAAEFANAAEAIRTGASTGVSVELRGPGGGGIPYAGFNQALISAYMRAWLIPAEAAGSDATVAVCITLRNDGTVISSRIERRSGNPELNASVQRALDKVDFVAPFPPSVKDTQKTFWLQFDPKAKQALG